MRFSNLPEEKEKIYTEQVGLKLTPKQKEKWNRNTPKKIRQFLEGKLTLENGKSQFYKTLAVGFFKGFDIFFTNEFETEVELFQQKFNLNRSEVKLFIDLLKGKVYESLDSVDPELIDNIEKLREEVENEDG